MEEKWLGALSQALIGHRLKLCSRRDINHSRNLARYFGARFSRPRGQKYESIRYPGWKEKMKAREEKEEGTRTVAHVQFPRISQVLALIKRDRPTKCWRIAEAMKFSPVEKSGERHSTLAIDDACRLAPLHGRSFDRSPPIYLYSIERVAPGAISCFSFAARTATGKNMKSPIGHDRHSINFSWHGRNLR